MAKEGKKFYIALTGDMGEKEIIDEYCDEARIEASKAQFNAGQISAAVLSIFPLDGMQRMRKLNLLYFFAGMRFAIEHKDQYEYTYKDYDPSEKKKAISAMEEVSKDDAPSYFG